jgi:thiamine biosynthesis lipoprotein
MTHTYLRAGPALLAALAALSIGCSRQAAESSRTDYVLGTLCSLRIVEGPRGAAAEKALDACFARLREIEDEMSVNKDGTELDRVNDAAGKEAVAVTDDVFFVIGKALEYARLTEGAFDPTVGPLVKLWGIGTEAARVPSKAEIAAARKLIDWRKVELDPAAKTVRLAKAGMRLDLGAIAKGYAADELKRILAANKVKAAIIDLGGNVYAMGSKRGGEKWRIGVQVPDPAAPRGEYLGVVEGVDMTVVTSGVYERYFESGGKRYHHILDTGTGYPVDNGLVSVTIVTGSSVDADGLSTSLFALGKERGMALAAKLPGVSVVMVDAGGKVYLSPGAGKLFTLTSESYALAD